MKKISIPQDVLIFITIISIKAISINFNFQIYDTGYLVIAIVACIGSASIAACILPSIGVKKRLFIFIIIDFLVSLLFVIDVVYNRYFSDVTSAALINQAKLIGDVESSVTELIHITDFLYFIDIPFVILYYIRYEKPRVLNGSLTYKKNYKSSALLLVLGILITLGSFKLLNIDQPGIMKTMYDKKYIVKFVGDLNFHIVDLYRYIGRNALKNKKLPEKELDSITSWYQSKNGKDNSSKKYFSSMKGKNLIIVQLESFQGFVLNRTINGQEITPNLNKLAKESMQFTNYRYEVGMGGTSDAEFETNVSLLPIKDGSVYYQYPGDYYDSLPKELKSIGYFTSIMHANKPGFWNRENMYMSLGFQDYENEKNYVQNDTVCLGLSDKSYVKQSIEKLKKQKQPFYTFMITLSSHYPFKDKQFESQLNVGEFQGKLIGDYLKSVKYTDDALGDLIEGLKESGLWDNSVVVFYGDHNAIPAYKKEELSQLIYGRTNMSDKEWFDLQKIVMMMHFPGSQIKGVNTSECGELDLYPTVANLYGINPKYVMGRDLLNTSSGPVLIRKYGYWIEGNVAYVKDSDKLYDLNTGKELSKSDYTKYFNDVDKYYDISDNVIEHDLIKKFEQSNK